MENANINDEEYYVVEGRRQSELIKNGKAEEVLNKYGLCFFCSLDGEARMILEQAMGIEQKSATDLYNAGVLAIQNDDFKAAEDWFKQALKQEAEYASPHFNLAQIYQQQGETTKAREQWRKYIEKEEAYQRKNGLRISNDPDDFDYLGYARDCLNK